MTSFTTLSPSWQSWKSFDLWSVRVINMHFVHFASNMLMLKYDRDWVVLWLADDSHVVWSMIQPSYVLLFSFVRCHLTVTITLITVVGTKARSLDSLASYTVKSIRISADILWQAFHILTEPVPSKYGKFAVKYLWIYGYFYMLETTCSRFDEQTLPLTQSTNRLQPHSGQYDKNY